MALWVKNVLDESYTENAIDLGAGVGADEYFFGRPRTFGMDFIVRF